MSERRSRVVLSTLARSRALKLAFFCAVAVALFGGAFLAGADLYVGARGLAPPEKALAAVVLYGGQGDETRRLGVAKELLDSGRVELIVCVGGARPLRNYYGSEESRLVLISAGAPPEKLRCEDRMSHDTITNIDAAVHVLGRKGWQRSVLVSDALHLLRADFLAFQSDYGRPRALAASGYGTPSHAAWRVFWELGAWLADFMPAAVRARLIAWTRH